MIRPARDDDRSAILEVHRSAFGRGGLVQQLWESEAHVRAHGSALVRAALDARVVYSPAFRH